jgi:hypothetical protein
LPGDTLWAPCLWKCRLQLWPLGLFSNFSGLRLMTLLPFHPTPTAEQTFVKVCTDVGSYSSSAPATRAKESMLSGVEVRRPAVGAVRILFF